MEAADGRMLVLGLGNPGPRYEGTRHNRGREVVEELARRRGVVLRPAHCQSRIAVEGDLLVATPETFMNRSGLAARCLVEHHSLDPARLLVVFDDIALPLGALRLRTRGGPGGQRGMASVLESLRTEEIGRMRLGVGPREGLEPGNDWTDLVLGRFAPDELDVAREQVLRAADACEVWFDRGAAEAMNRFNQAPPEASSARTQRPDRG